MAPRKKRENTKIREASRKKIIEAALELFAKKGYATTSVASIAQKANISKGLIYHYFNSKQEILKGIYVHFMQDAENIVGRYEEKSPKVFIRQMIEGAVDYIVYHTKLQRLLIALTLQPEVVEGIKEEMDKAKDIWMEQIIQAFKKMGYDNPEAEAYLLGAALDGVALGYVAMEKAYPLQQVKNLILKKYKL